MFHINTCTLQFQSQLLLYCHFAQGLTEDLEMTQSQSRSEYNTLKQTRCENYDSFNWKSGQRVPTLSQLMVRTLSNGFKSFNTVQCDIPENVHIHPMEGHWRLQFPEFGNLRPLPTCFSQVVLLMFLKRGLLDQVDVTYRHSVQTGTAKLILFNSTISPLRTSS